MDCIDAERMSKDAGGVVDDVVHEGTARRVQAGEIADPLGDLMVRIGRIAADAEQANPPAPSRGDEEQRVKSIGLVKADSATPSTALLCAACISVQ
jgi:hypothetical protein